MASFPPASAFKAAHLRLHGALAAMNPGSVIIDGVAYAGAVHVGAVTFEPLSTGGSARVQRLRVDIAKSKLALPPKPDTLVRHGGVDYKISETAGRGAHEAAWVIRCIRWLD